ncbi:MAG: CBS domain-containing protein [Roseiflexaceae bacterium]|nr:CBS domain-containing protein [Roseiflexaceae bacterium]
MKVLHGQIHQSKVDLLDAVSPQEGAHVLVLVLEGELERAAARSARVVAGSPAAPAPVQEQAESQSPRTVADLMTAELVTVNPRLPVTEAMHLMAAQGVTSLLVEPGAAGDWGIMTMRDVLGRIVRANRAAELVAAGEMASRPLITVSPDTDIQACSALMLDRKIRRVVVAENGRPLGIVSDTDIFRAVEQHGWGGPQ